MLESSDIRNSTGGTGDRFARKQSCIGGMALCAAVWSCHLMLVGRVLAQDGGGAPDPSAVGETSNIVVTQPFPYGGLFLLVVMVGLSLFAVCRSSRRN